MLAKEKDAHKHAQKIMIPQLRLELRMNMWWEKVTQQGLHMNFTSFKAVNTVLL